MEGGGERKKNEETKCLVNSAQSTQACRQNILTSPQQLIPVGAPYPPLPNLMRKRNYSVIPMKPSAQAAVTPPRTSERTGSRPVCLLLLPQPKRAFAQWVSAWVWFSSSEQLKSYPPDNKSLGAPVTVLEISSLLVCTSTQHLILNFFLFLVSCFFSV
jgi:hypothetical protein